MRILRKFSSDTRGATAIEYALLASLISIAAVAGYHTLGEQVLSGFTNVDATLNSAI